MLNIEVLPSYVLQYCSAVDSFPKPHKSNSSSAASMANNFIQHGRRACEVCHFLNFTDAVKNFTKRSMAISLTLSKIVLLLFKRPYVCMSPNPVLRKDV